MARKRREDADEENCDQRRERPLQRNAANARERARMRVLSKAFSRLKTSLPWVPADTKLSKLDTLRLAASYISHLRQILTEDGTLTGSAHPLTLTWPFTFSSRPNCQEDTTSAHVVMQNNCDVSTDLQDTGTDYRDFTSCEFFSPAIAGMQQQHRSIMGQYLQ